MTARAALLRSPLAFTPWGHRGELSDLSLDVNGVSLNFCFDVFGELVDVTGDWLPGGHREHHLDDSDELEELKESIARLEEKLEDANEAREKAEARVAELLRRYSYMEAELPTAARVATALERLREAMTVLGSAPTTTTPWRSAE